MSDEAVRQTLQLTPRQMRVGDLIPREGGIPQIITKIDGVETPIARIEVDHGFPYLLRERDYLFIIRWGAAPMKPYRGTRFERDDVL